MILKKLLTLIVPCYNSAAYMERCLKSLLPGGEQVEILIVDDGSTDQTGAIADKYAADYPEMVSVIHQANGGHGAAVTTGVNHAQGTYLKVVDSDDWLDEESYPKVLSSLKKFERPGDQLDMLITNFIYDKVGVKHKKTMSYEHLPQQAVFSWDDFKLHAGHYLLMHSVIYRTALLRDEVHLVLPQHCFYVDNLYVFEPLPQVKRMYYLNIPLYHYFIGRADQSVHENVMLRRIDQQLAVNRRMIDFYVDHVDPQTRCGRYMRSYLEIITTISSVLLVRGGSPEQLAKRDQLWQYLKAKDLKLYHQLKRRPFGRAVTVSNKLGRKMTVEFYKIGQKMYGFN